MTGVCALQYAPVDISDRYIGWRFAEPSEKDLPGENTVPDPLHEGYTHLRDIYFENNKDYEGRFTVPTLYDKKEKRIVSNESSEIIRMFYHEFDHLLPEKYKNIDLLPKDLEKDIEATNDWTYNDINNGVYKSGFATYVLEIVLSTDLADNCKAPRKPTRKMSPLCSNRWTRQKPILRRARDRTTTVNT